MATQIARVPLLLFAMLNLMAFFFVYMTGSFFTPNMKTEMRNAFTGRAKSEPKAREDEPQRWFPLRGVNATMVDDSAQAPGFLTFEWNGGRVNNNLMALVGALTVASRMNPPRTTILRKPRMAVNFNTPDYALIGLFEGYWDLEALTKAGYSWIMEDTAPAPELLQKEACRFNASQDQRNCTVVHFKDPFGWMKKEETAVNSRAEVKESVRMILQPAKWIKDIAESLVTEKFPSLPRISVHQRLLAWGNKEKHGSEFLCRGSFKNMASEEGESYRDAVQVWEPDNPAKRKELLNITEISCASSFPELQAVLQYWNHSLAPGEEFFMASDREREAMVQEMLSNGAVVIDPKEIDKRTTLLLPPILERVEKYNCSFHVCATRRKLISLAGVLVDSWAMTLGNFFVGSFYSTMSTTVCYWRGVARMHESNLCFLPSRLRAHAVLR